MLLSHVFQDKIILYKFFDLSEINLIQVSQMMSKRRIYGNINESKKYIFGGISFE
jgi:hypothetical protein